MAALRPTDTRGIPVGKPANMRGMHSPALGGLQAMSGKRNVGKNKFLRPVGFAEGGPVPDNEGGDIQYDVGGGGPASADDPVYILRSATDRVLASRAGESAPADDMPDDVGGGAPDVSVSAGVSRTGNFDDRLAEDLLAEWKARKAALPDRKALEEKEAKISALQEGALTRMLESSKAAEGGVNIPLLRASAALMAPTRTGGFGESLAAAGEAGAGALTQQRQMEAQRADREAKLQEAIAKVQSDALERQRKTYETSANSVDAQMNQLLKARENVTAKLKIAADRDATSLQAKQLQVQASMINAQIAALSRNYAADQSLAGRVYTADRGLEGQTGRTNALITINAGRDAASLERARIEAQGRVDALIQRGANDSQIQAAKAEVARLKIETDAALKREGFGVQQDIAADKNRTLLTLGQNRNDTALTLGQGRNDTALALGQGRNDTALALGQGRNDTALALGQGRNDTALALGQGRNDTALALGQGRNDTARALGQLRADTLTANTNTTVAGRQSVADTQGQTARDVQELRNKGANEVQDKRGQTATGVATIQAGSREHVAVLKGVQALEQQAAKARADYSKALLNNASQEERVRLRAAVDQTRREATDARNAMNQALKLAAQINNNTANPGSAVDVAGAAAQLAPALRTSGTITAPPAPGVGGLNLPAAPPAPASAPPAVPPAAPLATAPSPEAPPGETMAPEPVSAAPVPAPARPAALDQAPMSVPDKVAKRMNMAEDYKMAKLDADRGKNAAIQDSQLDTFKNAMEKYDASGRTTAAQGTVKQAIAGLFGFKDPAKISNYELGEKIRSQMALTTASLAAKGYTSRIIEQTAALSVPDMRNNSFEGNLRIIDYMRKVNALDRALADVAAQWMNNPNPSSRGSYAAARQAAVAKWAQEYGGQREGASGAAPTYAVIDGKLVKQ